MLLNYLCASKRDNLYEPQFSSIVPLFKMATSLIGKNSFPCGGGVFLPFREDPYAIGKRYLHFW